MAREREKKISKITRGSAWLSIVFYFIAYHVVAALLLAVVAVMFYNMLYAKISSESGSIKYLAKIYEASMRLNGENGLDVLNTDNRPFFVKDLNGNIIYEKGRNTCSDEGINIGIPFIGREVFVYEDTEEDYFKEGLLGFALFNFADKDEERSGRLDNIKIDNGEIVEEQAEKVNISLSDPGFGLVSFSSMADEIPVWLPVKINGGRYTLVAKVSIGMDVDDIELMVALVEVFILVNLLIFVILVFSVIRNIRRQKEITDLLYRDEDTEGRNWMWFLVYAEKTLCKRRNAGRRYALVNLFFVKYRNYCVVHSLEAGKKVLLKAYHTMCGYLGKEAMVAHVSSSSFALLMEYQQQEELKHRLEELIKELEKTDAGHKFTFQAGVALIDASIKRGRIRKRKDVNLEKDYNDACSARETMEHSEDSGIVFYDDRLMDEQKWIDAVNEHQEKALRNEEFLVYYQPKYSPDTNELRGAEALIRWQSPEYGFVSPGRIIPIFEKNGFITEIDHYMITHVARDQKRWLDQGYKCVPVSVNVSRAHFIEEDLAEQIRDMVDAAGAPRELIEIELTESAFFDDKNALINTINRLKSYGFLVSMDDFGAGYSSLNSLKDMALDVLKLDAEFFRGDADAERKEKVVAAAISLAKSLNMRTVAEGVEDREQVKFLADQHCDMIQGFIFAKPMPGADYEVRMREAANRSAGGPENVTDNGPENVTDNGPDNAADSVPDNGVAGLIEVKEEAD